MSTLPAATPALLDASSVVPTDGQPVVASLLAEVLTAAAGEPAERLDSPQAMLRCFARALGSDVTATDVARVADVLIARIDQLLERQVNAILHHPRFQALEAGWRGIAYLWDQAARAKQDAEDAGEPLPLKVRLLQLSKRELERDLASAIEFDQSKLFKLVYEMEFGLAEGEPFGLLVGDYHFTSHPADIRTLDLMSQVSAAAFSPFIAGVAPQFFQLDDFEQLERGMNLERDLQKPDYLMWRSLRERVDTRFIGLALPRILMRAPHEIDSVRNDGFRFHEDVSGRDNSKYLWGNAAYAFAGVVLRAYAMSGWFAEIRGFERGVDGGGLVSGLAAPSFATDSPGVAIKGCTEVAVVGGMEKDLSDNGFIPLCSMPESELAVFYTNPSVHKPGATTDAAVTANRKLASMLQYVLCSSRFAHYLKRYARDKLGTFQDPDSLETLLTTWIRQYVTVDEHATADVKARYPLRKAQIHVKEAPNKPGNYQLVIDLLPHYQLDDMAASLRLVTRLATGNTN